MADPNRALLESVVRLLAPVLDDLVFVGGCTTGLFITDPAASFSRLPPTIQEPVGHSYCVSANGTETENADLRLLLVAWAPLVVGGLAGLALLYLWRPRTSEHLRRLETARAIGTLSDAEYESLRRQLMAAPDMPAEQLEAIARGAKGQP